MEQGKTRARKRVGNALNIQDFRQLVDDDGIVHAKAQPGIGINGACNVDTDYVSFFIDQRTAGVAGSDGNVHLKCLIGGKRGGCTFADDASGDCNIVYIVGGKILTLGGIAGIAERVGGVADLDVAGVAQRQGSPFIRRGGQLQDGDILFLLRGKVDDLGFYIVVFRCGKKDINFPSVKTGIIAGIGIGFIDDMPVCHDVLNRLSGRADGPAGSHSGFAVSFVVIDCRIDHDDTVSGFIGILRGAFGQPCDAENG